MALPFLLTGGFVAIFSGMNEGVAGWEVEEDGDIVVVFLLRSCSCEH